jgi:hypothetical protein
MEKVAAGTDDAMCLGVCRPSADQVYSSGGVFSHHTNALSTVARAAGTPWCCELGDETADAISKHRRRWLAAAHQSFEPSV